MSVEEIRAEAGAPDGPALGVPTKNLLLGVLRNATAHLAGRNVIAVGRLIVSSAIARTYGKEVFGAYSLVIVLLAVAEWLLDFGTSDGLVREICRTPERGKRFLRMLTALKLLQIAVTSVLFVLVVVALGYPPQVVHAAFVAVISLTFFGGVLIYHVIFKATLTIEREVIAEFLSVLVMIALVRSVRYSSASPLVLIFACHAASRATFFGLCYLFGRARFRLSLKGVTWPDIRWSFVSSSTIGIIGLVVVLYESIDVLLISRFGSLSDVAYYSGAQRYIAPVVVALSAIGGTLYPVAASYWPNSRRDFEHCCQRAIDVVFPLAGMAICAILAGSNFLMRLIGPDLVDGAPVLRVLAIVLFFKAISGTLGPMLYVVKAETSALGMVALALLAKAVLIVLLVPHWGYIAAAFSAVTVDSATAAVTLYLFRRSSGVRLNWGTALKAILLTLVAAATAWLVFPARGMLSSMTALALFTILAFATHTVRLSEVLPLLKGKVA